MTEKIAKAKEFLSGFDGSIVESVDGLSKSKGSSVVSFAMVGDEMLMKTSDMASAIVFIDDDRYWDRLFKVMTKMGFGRKKKLYQDHLF